MILKILGILDILSAILIWFFGIFHLIPKEILVVCLLYLLIKGIFFLISADVASTIDVICAFILLMALFYPISKIFFVIISIYLLQKGLFSLAA